MREKRKQKHEHQQLSDEFKYIFRLFSSSGRRFCQHCEYTAEQIRNNAHN